MRTNGNQSGANGKSVGQFKGYILPFVINGNSMVNHWENSNGIFYHSLLMEYYWEYFSGNYFDSVLMGVQFHVSGNILMVLITIHLLGKFNGISLRTL